ncbi:MAG: S1 family peptidase [Acidiferrobacterales bacterium]
MNLKLAPLLLLISCCVVPRNGDPDIEAARNITQSTVLIQNLYPVMRMKEGKLRPDMAVNSGTGVVVKKRKLKDGTVQSMILTAAHVAELGTPHENGKELKLIGPPVQGGIALNGDSCALKKIYVDPKADVGLLIAGCDLGEPVDLADDLPGAGARVTSAGCPEGICPPWSTPFFDGRMDGIAPRPSRDEKDMVIDVLVSIPVFPGMSGSGIFYRGRLFGLIAERTQEFPDLAFGPTLLDIQRALIEGEKAWQTP